MAVTWAAKDPDDIADYLLDWAARLGEDQIATSIATLTLPAGVSIDAQSHTAQATRVVLSGGEDGALAAIQVRITTQAGNQWDETVYIPIISSALSGGAGYGSDAGLIAWLSAQGNSLVGSLPPAILRQRGSDYIDGLYGARFSGVPAGGIAQERAWPRTGATAYCQAIPDDVIPIAVINASYAAALQEADQPGSLSVVASAAGAVKREKVGQIETEYFGGDGNAALDAAPILSAVEGLLAPFLRAEAVGGIGIWVV